MAISQQQCGRRRTYCRAVMASALSIGVLALSPFVGAAPMAYTSSTAFFAALPSPAQILSFDTLTAGSLINSDDTLAGITFSYDFGVFDSGPNIGQPLRLAVTDGDQFGGGGPFDTTSSPNFLGTNDADVLQDGDEFSISFGPSTAIGMYFLSADTLFDDDITLDAAGETASLIAADVEQTLPDGTDVFFLGVIDAAQEFTSAEIKNIGGGFFLYNVDDIVTTSRSVSIPASWALLLCGSIALAVARRRNSRNPKGETNEEAL